VKVNHIVMAGAGSAEKLVNRADE